MTQQSFEPTPMTEREHDLLRTLRTHMTLEKLDTFTVDTLRMLGMDRFMQKDARGYINFGSLIRKWQFYGHIESTGKLICSTYEGSHSTRIQVWKLKQ